MTNGRTLSIFFELLEHYTEGGVFGVTSGGGDAR
jgi:hypothetical protein